jgi:hypothetical protein
MITPDAFPAALAAAKPGAVLELADEDYGVLTLSKRSGLTIKGGRFTSANITVSNDIDIDGASFDMPYVDGTTMSWSNVVRIYQCDGVSVRNSKLTGPIVPDDA